MKNTAVAFSCEAYIMALPGPHVLASCSLLLAGKHAQQPLALIPRKSLHIPQG